MKIYHVVYIMIAINYNSTLEGHLRPLSSLKDCQITLNDPTNHALLSLIWSTTSYLHNKPYPLTLTYRHSEGKISTYKLSLNKFNDWIKQSHALNNPVTKKFKKKHRFLQSCWIISPLFQKTIKELEGFDLLFTTMNHNEEEKFRIFKQKASDFTQSELEDFGFKHRKVEDLSQAEKERIYILYQAQQKANHIEEKTNSTDKTIYDALNEFSKNITQQQKNVKSNRNHYKKIYPEVISLGSLGEITTSKSHEHTLRASTFNSTYSKKNSHFLDRHQSLLINSTSGH